MKNANTIPSGVLKAAIFGREWLRLPSSLIHMTAILAMCASGFAAEAPSLSPPVALNFEMVGMSLQSPRIGIVDDTLVESFYENERAVAGRFETLARQQLGAVGLTSELRTESNPAGGIEIYSKTIAAEFGKIIEGTRLKPSVLANTSQEEVELYLKGAYSRFKYKQGLPVYVVNYGTKARDLQAVLERAKCTNVEVYRTPSGVAPSAFVITFIAAPDLQKILGLSLTSGKADELREQVRKELGVDQLQPNPPASSAPRGGAPRGGRG